MVRQRTRQVTRPQTPQMATVREAAQILQVHPNTVRKWSDKGLFKTYRIGTRRDRRFLVEDLIAFLTGNPRPEEKE